MREEQYSIHAELGLIHWWYYGTNKFFHKLIKKSLLAGSSVLDAGCGMGNMIVLLKNEYYVIGIDCSKTAIYHCIEKKLDKNIILGSVDKLPFDDASFDGVLSLDVLYHKWISDDLHALKEIYRILKPRGKVFIQVPAYNWLRSSHDEWAYSSRRYTAQELNNLLADAGFLKKNIGYRVSILFPFALLKRILFKGCGSDMKETYPLINYILKKIISFENHLILSLSLSFPFGLSVYGVAEK